MPKMFFSEPGCKGAQSGTTGREYKPDRNYMFDIKDEDVKSFKDGGYMMAGGMPRLRKFWVCDGCSWEAAINSCPKCGSTDLRKVVR